VLYVGQATGSAIGGFLYAGDLLRTMGFVGATFVALAVALVLVTRPRSPIQGT
jgi:predicted MFS family arabinose efflux permease